MWFTKSKLTLKQFLSIELNKRLQKLTVRLYINVMPLNVAKKIKLIKEIKLLYVLWEYQESKEEIYLKNFLGFSSAFSQFLKVEREKVSGHFHEILSRPNLIDLGGINTHFSLVEDENIMYQKFLNNFSRFLE